MKLPKRAHDWAGTRVGYVVAVRPLRQDARKHNVIWECKCDCGKTVEKTSGVLKRGVTYCSHSCSLKPTVETHGGSYLKEYRAWIAMKSRCFTPNHKNYGQYGARGITVHPEWVDDFQKFVDYVGKAPSPKHTLDRIDPDGNYEPGNIRWLIQYEQNLNKRNTVYIKLGGERVPLASAAEERGVSYGVAYQRYARGKRGEDIFRSAYTNWEGVRQGMLTVHKENGRDRHGNKLWDCSCDCGAVVQKSSKDLRQGVKSCSAACGVSASNRARAKA